jgi:hypothetical protein
MQLTDWVDAFKILTKNHWRAMCRVLQYLIGDATWMLDLDIEMKYSSC